MVSERNKRRFFLIRNLFQKNSLFGSLMNCVNNQPVQFVRCSVISNLLPVSARHFSAKAAVQRLADKYFNHDDRFSINLLLSTELLLPWFQRTLWNNTVCCIWKRFSGQNSYWSLPSPLFYSSIIRLSCKNCGGKKKTSNESIGWNSSGLSLLPKPVIVSWLH